VRRPSRSTVILLQCGLLAAGCQSYTEATAQARDAYYSKDYDRSLSLWTEACDAGLRGNDAPLLLLERGMVHLAAGRYAEAARDLLTGDQRLEILDFSGNPGEVGKYLFSEDSGLYRGPPHEKILAPTLTSLAWAAAGDDQKARTAANAAYSQAVRFEQFDAGGEHHAPLVYILVGIWAERDGDTQSAYTAYEAACSRQPIPSLAPALARLLDENARRFGGHWLQKRAAGNGPADPPPPLAADHGEVVVVVLNGRAPIRAGSAIELNQAQRRFLREDSLPRIKAGYPKADLREAQQLIGRQHELPMAVIARRPSRFVAGSARVAGSALVRLEEVLDVERQVEAWDGVTSGARTAAALSRMAIRMAVRIGTYLTVKKETQDSLMALLAATFTGAALDAVDTPDTRCWTLLPKQVLFERCPLPAGRQPVEVVMTGPGGEISLLREVEVKPGGVTFAVFVVPD
jgi:hypothetical protein